jgi:integrase
MPVYKRGGSFLLCMGSGPSRFRKAFKTHEEATKEEQRRSILIEAGLQSHLEPPPAPRRVNGKATPQATPAGTLEQAFRLTSRDVWDHRRSDTSKRQAKVVLRMLGENTLCKDVTTSMIREMADELTDQGLVGNTINQKLSALSMMLKTAADEGWIETLPRIKRRTAGTHRVRWLDGQEELEVLEQCQSLGLLSLRDFVICAIDTGFRRMELLGFSLKDYRNGMLHLHGDQTKTAKPRSIPVTSRVAEIISRRQNNILLFDDLSASKLRNQWAVLREAMGKLDDPQFVVHMLRHTCASRLAMQDKSAQFIQLWMGHSTPLTTARYMHLAPAKLREGIEALEDYRKNSVGQLRVVSA